MCGYFRRFEKAVFFDRTYQQTLGIVFVPLYFFRIKPNPNLEKMKRTATLVFLSALLTVYTLKAQPFYQRQLVINSTTTSFNGVKDIVVEPGGTGITILTDVVSGTTPDFRVALFKYDAGVGNSVSSSVYGATGASLGSHVAKFIGGNYYVLCSYSDNITFINKLLLLSVNGTSGLVNFAKVFDASILGVDVPLELSDMDYDGSAFLYVTGNAYVLPSGSPSLFALQLDLSGGLNWARYYFTPTTEENAHNIDFHDNGAIYIGATTWPASNQLMRTGLVLQIDNSGGFVNSKNIFHYTPAGSPRMFRFFVTRVTNQPIIIVAGSTLAGADGAGPMLLATLNTSLNMMNYSVFSSPEFFLTQAPIARTPLTLTSKIMLTGSINMTGGSNGYVNAFFAYNTNFLSGSRYDVISTIFSSIASDMNASGIVYSAADNETFPKRIYRLRANAANAATVCSDPYVFTEIPGPYNELLFPMSKDAITGSMNSRNMNPPIGLPLNNLSACAPPAPTHSMVDEQPVSAAVYPNPATTEITLSLGDAGADKIELFDFRGKLVREITVAGSNQVSISISDLAGGIYLVRIIRGAETESLRFIKQ
ncbi:MAG: PKD domain-containing protein [Bacteroidetes bacterium]|nr:MAG: PKD domain-containing protein [Bacteroidota bacterium]